MKRRELTKPFMQISKWKKLARNPTIQSHFIIFLNEYSYIYRQVPPLF